MGNPPVPPQPPASSLNTAELENSTIDELKLKANAHFSAAQNPGYIGNDEHLLQAQVYLAEISHRDDARIARRDFRLEIIVIFLIGLEIIVAGVEGWKQGTVLDNMADSTKKTASAMGDAADALKTLRDDQKLLLAAQGTANTNLQDNLKQTSAMATALQKQLKIIQQEQAERESQLSKKPKLELGIAGVPLNTAIPVNYKVREQTDTTVSFDFGLVNSGNATATKGLVRVIVQAKDAGLTCSSPFQKIAEEPDSLLHAYIIPFDFVRPRANLPLTITFTFPKSQPPFAVLFNVDAEEIETGTFLGQILVRPRKPLN